MNYVWDIPTPASLGTFPKAILGNWEAGGILTIQSGTPFTVLVSGDPLGEGNTDPFQYPDLTNKACRLVSVRRNYEYWRCQEPIVSSQSPTG